ncbi:MAG: PQQ-binding-like beta-propeller repeat protein, partial [Pseudomonadota bacterium]
MAAVFGLAAATNAAQADPTVELGAKLYQDRCAACHEGGVPEAPRREAMAALSPEAVRRALTDGVMQAQAAGLGRTDIAFISQYVAAGAVTAFDASKHSCPGKPGLDGATGWNRWGNGLDNRRFQPAAVSGLNAANVAGLELKWAFGFPGAVRARSQPAIAGEMLFTGSQDGAVYALNAATGCIWWTFEAEAEVRNAITVRHDDDGKPESLYFGDFAANVYRIDAATGRLRWRVDVSDHPAGTITGSVTLAGDQLFVPMSSTEVISAYDPAYNCCTFRGGVLALNADSGERQWRFYTVDEPRPQAKNSEGRQLYGPSGAPVWSTPTVDEARGL